jgi:hypothetical protein
MEVATINPLEEFVASSSTLWMEPVHNFEKPANIYQIIRCPIANDRNLNQTRH